MVGGGIRCREYGNAMSVKGWGYESGMKLLTLIVQSRYARRREKERRRVCMDRKRASRDPRIQKSEKRERRSVGAIVKETIVKRSRCEIDML